MIGSIVRLLPNPFTQDVARTNAQQAAARLAHRRRERQEVEVYLAQHSEPSGTRGPISPPDVHEPSRRGG